MRGLRLAYPIALVTTDVKRLPEVVEYPCLAEAVTYMPDAVQRDAVRRHQVGPVAAAVEDAEQGGGQPPGHLMQATCGCLADRGEQVPAFAVVPAEGILGVGEAGPRIISLRGIQRQAISMR